MPTSREWLEHTERAAWDTVQSLRRQIEEERVRIARLTPVRESWQRIIEVLDVAKVESGITAEHYADVVEALSAELRRVKEEREQLSYKLEAEQKASRGVEQRVEVIALEADERPRKSGRVRWFADKIAALRRERAALLRGRKPPGLDRLIAALEAKVDELEGATAAEMVRIAIDLGALALRVAEHAERRNARRRGLHDEEE
jgi:DNA repair exonuclease SbcCD ATPase subunit